jgi:hypothetical protein
MDVRHKVVRNVLPEQVTRMGSKGRTSPESRPREVSCGLMADRVAVMAGRYESGQDLWTGKQLGADEGFTP